MIGSLTESRDSKWLYAETIVILRGCQILSADSPAGQNYLIRQNYLRTCWLLNRLQLVAQQVAAVLMANVSAQINKRAVYDLYRLKNYRLKLFHSKLSSPF